MIGKTISHYRIIERLGEGGMGVVYRAEDTKLEREVALKFLSAGALGTEEEKARFVREAKAAAAIHHASICTVYEIDEDDGRVFIAMALLQGESLRDRIRRAPLTLDETLITATQIAEGLAAAHARGIVHRDVKPRNVMVTPEGRASVMDFGLAKSVGQTTLTKTGTTTGTVAYMSPEQARGEDVDQRTDIWSFGVMLYEMVTGLRPFAGDRDQAIIYSLLNEEPSPITGLRSGVPMELERIIVKAMAKSPAERYQHIEDMLVDLRALARATDEGVEAAAVATRRLSAQPRAGKSRWRMAGITLAIAIVVVAAVITLTQFMGARETEERERVVVAVFENRTADESLDHVGIMAADWIAQGLVRMDLVQVVPVGLAESAGLGLTGKERISKLADAAGADIVIAGAYYLQGETLQFHAQIVGAEDGEILSSIEPLTGFVETPLVPTERLSQKVMGALGVIVDPSFRMAASARRSPPTYEAYREYVLGQDLFIRLALREALSHLYRAATIDTAFGAPLMLAATAHINLGEFAEADSLVHVIEKLREGLSRPAQLMLDWHAAMLAGRRTDALSACRQGAALAPGTPLHLQWGVEAVWLNRPEEAIEALTGLGRETPLFRDWGPWWYYLGLAHHMMGRFEEESLLGRRGRSECAGQQSFGGRLLELRAAAAMGDRNEVMHLLDEILALPASPPTGGPASAYHLAASELRAHGHADASREVIDRALEWLGNRPEEEKRTEYHRAALARTLYYAESWQDALTLIQSLRREDPESVDYLGYEGVLAARMGETHDALSISEQLGAVNGLYGQGNAPLWRARIATIVNEDDDRAMGHLRDALAQGLIYPRLHADIDLEPLRGHTAFEELMRPKG